MAVSGRTMTIMSNNNEFIKKYNELDALIDEKFNRESDDSSIYFLINKYRRSKVTIEREYANKLDSARKIRNLMIHETGIIDELFQVSEEVIAFLDELIKYIKDPIIALDVLTPINKLIYATKDSLVKDLIRKIVEEGVSNLPVLNSRNHVIGVFNSDVLLLLAVEGIKINEETRIADIEKFLTLDKQLNLRFIFVTSGYEIDVLNDYFSYSKEKYEKRLPMIFVSENGKSDSPLIGVISPIDLIRKSR